MLVVVVIKAQSDVSKKGETGQFAQVLMLTWEIFAYVCLFLLFILFTCEMYLAILSVHRQNFKDHVHFPEP